jgi:glycine/D-amino acid oxidase-like deaminating enzyme
MKTVFERVRPAAHLVDAALRDSRLASFWIDDAPGVRYPQLPGETRADLVVVGGGYGGLWTAIHAKLRNPHRSVVLLEARTTGWAASGRNGGFCEASLTHGHDNGLARWPDEIDRLDALGLKNLDDMEKAVRDLRLDCEFERNGGLSVAVEKHQVPWLREGAKAGHSGPTNDSTVFLDTNVIRAEVNSPTYLGGLWERRSSALVHPGQLAAELARAATDLGVEIFEHTHAEGLESSGRSGPVNVQTPMGRVHAERVVLATNAFPALLRRYRRHTVPVYDYVVMTELLTDQQLADIGWSRRQGIGDNANQFHYYRLTRDNRILFGGYDAIYHYGGKVRARYEDRDESYRRLVSHLLTTFPQLEGIRISHRWAGAIDTDTRFCAFFATAMRGRVAHTAGFTGLGIAATYFAGQVLLDLVDKEQTERTGLAMVRSKPLPFPPEPLAALGIQATRWSLDRADHNEGRRNLWLRALDKAGLGFDS